MDMDTGRWVAAGEVGPNDETFTATGLTPKKKYKFRVKAVNKDGESEALETDEAIMARNPYGRETFSLFTNNLMFTVTFHGTQMSLANQANQSSKITRSPA